MNLDYAETGAVAEFDDVYEASGYPELRGKDSRSFAQVDEMARVYRDTLLAGDVMAVTEILETCIARVDPDDPTSPLIRDQIQTVG